MTAIEDNRLQLIADQPSSSTDIILSIPYIDPKIVECLEIMFSSSVSRLAKTDYDLRHVSEMIGEQKVINYLKLLVDEQEERHLK